MPSPPHHAELALYADDTAVIATSRQPAVLVKYLETYLSNLERCLCEWRIYINISKSSSMLFAKAYRRSPNPITIHLFGELIQFFQTVCFLGGNPFLMAHLVETFRSGEKESGT